jgi:hypothetical protein
MKSKTIGFSKKTEELDNQMVLYIAHYNFCRTYRSLKYKSDTDKISCDCTAKHAGLIDRVWSMEQLLTFPYYKIQLVSYSRPKPALSLISRFFPV